MVQMRISADALWAVSYSDRPLHVLPSREAARSLITHLAAQLDRFTPCRDEFEAAMRAWATANPAEAVTPDILADETAWWGRHQDAGEAFLRQRGCADDALALVYWALMTGDLPIPQVPTSLLFSVQAVTPASPPVA